MSINKVFLLGNLAADPQVKEFDGGGKVASFRVATTERGYTTKSGQEVPERTEFHNVVIKKSGLAGVADKFLHKGDKVHIEGSLHYRTYKDKDGVDRYITEVQVESMEMLTPKVRNNSKEGDDGHPSEEDPEKAELKKRGEELVEALDAEGLEDDDLPF